MLLSVCGEVAFHTLTNSLTLELSIISSICGIRKGITDIFLCRFLVCVLMLRTYRVDAPHGWCGRLARMVRRIKHIVIYRRERDKLLANTKERMYLCCSNSGATIERYFNGNAITKNNYEQKKSSPLCSLDSSFRIGYGTDNEDYT